jgi:DNA adenine methylase
MVDSIRHSQYESPLRYPGGKACLFPFISKLLYENNLIGTNYAEPYAGGSGLALKLLFNEYVNNIYINDYDYSIYCFWKTILNSNTRFCDWIESVEISVDSWYHFKNIHRNSHNYNEFEVAQSTFFLNRTNISGVIKGGPIGGFMQNGEYKLDARFNKNDLIMRISRINNFRNRITVTNLDGLRFINNLNKLSENIFVYLDPPYFQKGADLYMNYFKKKDHSTLAKKVNLIKHRWLVSYDNNEFILSLYKKHRKLIYRLSQSASNRIGDEILIFSDIINYGNSIEELSNPLEI